VLVGTTGDEKSFLGKLKGKFDGILS
jgi:hypothetical protein